MVSPIEAYIRARAPLFGVDPDIAVRVAKSEGGLVNPTQQSFAKRPDGSREESYGPFQLYMGGGLGNRAMAAGIDPRKESDWQRGVDFALAEAGKKGWGQWYGAAKAGIGDFEGISSVPKGAPVPGLSMSGVPGSAGVYTTAMNTSVGSPPGSTEGTPVASSPAAEPQGFVDRASAFAKTDEAKNLAGILDKMAGGGEQVQEAPIQSVLPALAAEDAARMQSAQALMQTLMAGKRNRGLTLGGVPHGLV